MSILDVKGSENHLFKIVYFAVMLIWALVSIPETNSCAVTYPHLGFMNPETFKTRFS